MKLWGQQATQDIVGQEHLFPLNPMALVFPLPPLVGAKWDKNVVHAPEIPLPNFGQPGVPGMIGGFGRGMPGAGPGSKQPGAGPGSKQPGAAAGEVQDPFGDIPPGQVAPQPGGASGGTTGGGPAAAGADTSTYLLFRFFDFNVEPGKQYVYRVQLC